MTDENERHSEALDADLIKDPDRLAEREARNGLEQYDAVIEIVDSFKATPEREFKLRPSLILHLNRKVLDGISAYAGNYRPAGITIGGSAHQPVGAHQVPELVEELCDYVNGHWDKESAIHLAAYVMWRLNWIHPFTDGNGRTSRALSYLVLCMKLGDHLPGINTIPAQVAGDKKPYYRALETADKALADTEKVSLDDMEKLLGDLLVKQLASVLKAARK